MKNNNKKILASFVKFCSKNPELRFWQALRTWSGIKYIYACNDPTGEGRTEDTFSWEGKNK